MNVDIEGLDKAKLFKALCECAWAPDIAVSYSDEQIGRWLKMNRGRLGIGSRNNETTVFLDLRHSSLDTTDFNLMVGPGSAERVIANLREKR